MNNFVLWRSETGVRGCGVLLLYGQMALETVNKIVWVSEKPKEDEEDRGRVCVAP